MLAVLIAYGQIGPALGYFREANAALKDANRTLEGKLDAALREIKILQTKTDLAPMQAALLAAMESHETNAALRSERLLGVLSMIADRLGPNGGA